MSGFAYPKDNPTSEPIMLDVHPPHEATHTWKDFFIHIATICVGLLIAVGLEQSVEAIHRHNETVELRESLDHESEQIIRDTTNVETDIDQLGPWYQQMEQQVSNAALQHKPVGAFPPRPTHAGWDVPDNPVYTAAKAGTRIALLNERETVDYGELGGVLIKVAEQYRRLNDTSHTWDTEVRKLYFGRASTPSTNPLATATLTNDELKQLYSDLDNREEAIRRFAYWCRQARGAATALHQGERNLHKIESAERQFDNQPLP